MFKFWKTLTYTTKFSVIGFFTTLALGLLSMGALGYALYYPVAFLLKSKSSEWHGDWVWPTTIFVGMAWSVGFVFAGIAWHYLSKYISSVFLLRLVYVGILYLWIYILWSIALLNNIA